MGVQFGAFSISGSSQSGKTIATSSQSGRTALPKDAAGVSARFVRLSVTQNTFVRPGSSTVTASSTGLMIQSGDGVVLSMKGYTYLAFVRESSSGKINLYAVEF